MHPAHPTSEDKKRHRLGFSMAEIMVVVVVIGIIAGATVPSLVGRMSSYELRDTAIKVKLLGDEARTLAARLRVPVYLRIDANEGRAWLEPQFNDNFDNGFVATETTDDLTGLLAGEGEGGGSAEAARQLLGLGKQVTWSKRIAVAGIDIESSDYDEDAGLGTGIQFKPDLKASAAAIQFAQADRPGKVWTVLVDGMTATCQAWYGLRERTAVWRMDLDA